MFVLLHVSIGGSRKENDTILCFPVPWRNTRNQERIPFDSAHRQCRLNWYIQLLHVISERSHWNGHLLCLYLMSFAIIGMNNLSFFKISLLYSIFGCFLLRVIDGIYLLQTSRIRTWVMIANKMNYHFQYSIISSRKKKLLI